MKYTSAMRFPAWLLLAPLLLGAGHARHPLEDEATRWERKERGLELGIQVWREGSGVVYSRGADRYYAAASAIKTAIALDLLVTLGDRLQEVPAGLENLLRSGTHPAMDGFSRERLDAARRALAGKSYWELARIMMGRAGAPNEVYNAACNVLMVKLGGPAAIERRIRGLDPAYAGIDINRYMQAWHGDGDNTATPATMVHLYRQVSRGSVPGLRPENVDRLRSLLLEDGDGSAGSVFEKGGTLYPKPMARVHAGYVKREGGDLVYAVMGEIADTSDPDPAGQFVRLMYMVDGMAERCRNLER